MLIAINLQKYRPIGRLHLLKNCRNCTYIYISVFVERFCFEKNRFSETVIFFLRGIILNVSQQSIWFCIYL